MFHIGDNIDQFNRSLSDVGQKQLPFAMALALNDTATDVVKAEQQHMQQVFDRPTRWTLNAFQVRRASKTKLTATIERKSAIGRRFYLEVQEKGGGRRQTGIERLMIGRLKYPGIINAITPAEGAKLNVAGNMSPAFVQRVLSAVQVQRDQLQNTTTASRGRARGRAQYFVPRPGSKLSPGVWERKARKGGIQKVMHFTQSEPRYRARFKFDEVAERTARKVFERHLSARLRQAIATAK